MLDYFTNHAFPPHRIAENYHCCVRMYFIEKSIFHLLPHYEKKKIQVILLRKVKSLWNSNFLKLKLIN